ncbi:dynein axonemal assembly factor 4-like [Macrosteles quadrilineatus]|uniref:dynein axonemal assembly factor 4-like n=1 Tax=Macrosteles quadrilineatus TaxID=74068 RepID=UPI0023E2C994|nr:dynein axonemal assembly factor 4-like [Macrosteles quadrilineatus]
MPIVLKNFSWNQSDSLVFIHVPLKGVGLKNIDIFTADRYLKIHSPPHLFEICLWKPIVEAESSCSITNGEAIFSLVKQTAETWPCIAADISRQEAVKVKQEAIEVAQARAEERRKEIAATKDKRQKEAVKEQIRLNTEERELIEKTREYEKTSALAQMGWIKKSAVQITELPEEKQKHLKAGGKEDKSIFKEKILPERRTSYLPAPRQPAEIAVSFTPRVFPTPCRESKIAEEQEWLSKQAEARRRTGFVAEDLLPEERDPLWLCDKAQSFYDVGNYLGAVSAYSHALTLNSHMYEIYAGRANAHLKLGNFNKAVIDSSKALELLTPPVPANAASRAKCLQCRGSALAALGLHSEAAGEFHAALKLTPDCQEIQQALAELQTEESQDGCTRF